MLLGGLIFDGAVVLGLALYWLPTIVAGLRRADNATAVFLFNLLLGWSVIGWIVSLWMASTADVRPRA